MGKSAVGRGAIAEKLLDKIPTALLLATTLFWTVTLVALYCSYRARQFHWRYRSPARRSKRLYSFLIPYSDDSDIAIVRYNRVGGHSDRLARRPRRLSKTSNHAVSKAAECLIQDRDAPRPHRALQGVYPTRPLAAPPRWPQPIVETHCRGKVHRRNRGRRTASSERCRLIASVTNIRR
jgi:hypothetical protein